MVFGNKNKECIFVSRMKNRILNMNRKVIVLLFLGLIGGYLFNSTFFLHTHLSSNGKITQHAHPFKKSSEDQKSLPKHNHTCSDFLVIDNSSLLFNSVNEVLITSTESLIGELKVCQSYDYIDYYFTSLNSRGPPFIYFSV